MKLNLPYFIAPLLLVTLLINLPTLQGKAPNTTPTDPPNANEPQVCYTLTTPSPTTQTICLGAAGTNLTVRTNTNIGGGVRFVYYTTDQMAGATPTLAESNYIYNYTGAYKDIAYLTATGATSPYTATYTFYPDDFPNTTNANITYYVYAVFNNGVVNSTCGTNPVLEMQVIVKPKPKITIPLDQYVCAGSSTTAVTLAGSGVSGTTYAWTNSTTSIGLAASGSATIPSFTATNATASPVTATITATPTANACAGTPVTSKIIVYPSSASMLSGVAFSDFNENGVREAAEGVQPGVVAKVYNCTGTLMGTSTTDANGYWSVSGLTFGGATDKYRVEFSIPAALSATGLLPSANGTNNKTDVQFITAASCNINFGVNYTSTYCKPGSILAVPIYSNGSRAANPNEPAVVLFNDTDRGQGLSQPSIATLAEVGAVWGEAYNPKTKKLYLSAFVKRHSDLSPNGLGAIYEIDLTTPTSAGAGTPSLWLDINAATFVNTSNVAVNLGFPADPGAASRGLGLKTVPSRDNWAFDYVGKQGIGDIEMSEDGQRLYVMDLTNRQVLCINTSTKKLMWKLAVSTPTCLGGSGDIRPWALKEHKGILYVGAVCSGETNNNSNQLRYYIMKCNSLTAATSMSLAVDMGSSILTTNGAWNFWAANATEANIASAGNNNYIYFQQPLVSDIEFDKDENIIIGVMDRFGHQSGFANYLPNVTNTNLAHGIANGDITRALQSGGTYTNETAPWTFFFLTANVPSPPVDQFMGGMVVSSGSGVNYVTANLIDPFTYNSGGVTWLKTSDGQQQGGTEEIARLELYPDAISSPETFGKANGLGDIELLCDIPPLQIGNYVWVDADKDGVQDGCEASLSNITVSLWKSGTQIASTTTNASGEYYFSSKSALGAGWTGTGADTTLLPNTAYEVRLLLSQSGISTPGYQLTTVNSTTSSGNDQNDTDASTNSGYAVIALTTGDVGSVNHTYDFGFFQCPTITNPSAAQNICLGAAGSNMTVNTSYNTANGIRFVKFTTDQTATNGSESATELTNIYTTGTAIATVTPTGASSPYTATYTFSAADFPNATSAPITYYVYAILNPDQGTNCRPIQEIQITIKPTPSVTAPSNQAVCNSASTTAVTFSGSAVAGTTYNWTNNTPSIGLAASGTGTIPAFTATNAGSTAVTATITVTPIANGCPGTAQTFTITVSPTITVATVTADTATCTNGIANSDAKITLSGIVGGTKYSYGTSGTTGLFASGATTLSGSAITLTGLANPSTLTTYTFRIYAADTLCYTDRTVVLKPSVCPIPCNTITMTPTILPGGQVGVPYSAQVNATGGTAPYQFIWYAGSTGVLPDGLSIDANGLVSGTPTTSGSYAVKIAVVDANFCPDTLDPAVLDIMCVSNLTVKDTAICNGATVNLFSLASGASGTMSYSTNGTTWAALSNPTIVNPSLTTTYFIMDTLTGGCFDIDTLLLTVYPIPNLGSDVTLTCPSGGGQASTSYDFAFAGTWTVLSQPAGASAAVSPGGLASGLTLSGDYNLRVTVNGCSDDVKITVPFCCPVAVCVPIVILKN